MGNPQVSIGALGKMASGSTLQLLVENNMDPGVLRPWYEVDKKGRPLVDRYGRRKTFVALREGVKVDDKGAVVLNENGTPRFNYRVKEMVTNAPTLLRRSDWLIIDRAVQWQNKLRTSFAAAMRSAVSFNLANYWENLSIETAVANGDADVQVSMDPIRKAERSRADFKTTRVPLPIIHGDGAFSARDLAVAKKSGLPLDTTQLGLIARKIQEVLEKLCLGTLGTYSFLGGTIYGATNYPNRITGTFTLPTTGGWVPKTLFDQINAKIQVLKNAFFYGPYSLYYSTNLAQYMNGDYSVSYVAPSLRARLEEIPEITEVTALDFLTDNTILLIQWTPEVADYIFGWEPMAVQWEEQGGLELVFKVMAAQVPRFKADYAGNTGVLHLTGA